METEFVKRTVKEIIEAVGQELVPMLFVFNKQGKMGIVPLSFDKELWAEAMKIVIEKFGASEYIMVSEAFSSTLAPDTELAKKIMAGEMKIKDLHPDNREDIVYMVEVKNTGDAIGHMAIIDKTPEGKRVLRPWTEMKDISGRFVLSGWKVKKAKELENANQLMSS